MPPPNSTGGISRAFRSNAVTEYGSMKSAPRAVTTMTINHSAAKETPSGSPTMRRTSAATPVAGRTAGRESRIAICRS